MDMTEERVVQASLTWLLLIVVGVFLTGMLGGWTAAWWSRPKLPVLPNAQDRLITTIQEVTISPNTAAADVVARHERSTVTIARASQLETALATGIMVTSDGIVATTAALPEGELVIIDNTGRPLAAARVGQDSIYGITYLRASSGVFVPMEVRNEPIPVGSTLLTLSRAPETSTPRVRHYLVEEYRLPIRGEAMGWQQIIQGTAVTDTGAVGSALLDEEGAVAGLLLPGENGRAIPSSYLQTSLKRLAQNQIEANPFAEHGIAGEFSFPPSHDTHVFALTVTAVTPGSPAHTQGLRAGDTIESINGKPLAWQESLAEILASKEPVALQVRRNETTRTITL